MAIFCPKFSIFNSSKFRETVNNCVYVTGKRKATNLQRSVVLLLQGSKSAARISCFAVPLLWLAYKFIMLYFSHSCERPYILPYKVRAKHETFILYLPQRGVKPPFSHHTPWKGWIKWHVWLQLLNSSFNTECRTVPTGSRPNLGLGFGRN